MFAELHIRCEDAIFLAATHHQRELLYIGLALFPFLEGQCSSSGGSFCISHFLFEVSFHVGNS